MKTYQIVGIVFDHIFPAKEVTVALAEAWAYYAEHQTVRVSRVVLRDCDGKEDSNSYAKGWTIWDFKTERHLLATVGAGAYGDSFQVHNPEVIGKPVRQRLGIQGGWCSGINADQFNPENFQ